MEKIKTGVVNFYKNDFKKVVGRSWTQSSENIELNEILEIEKEYPIFKELYEK